MKDFSNKKLQNIKNVFAKYYNKINCLDGNNVFVREIQMISNMSILFLGSHIEFNVDY